MVVKGGKNGLAALPRSASIPNHHPFIIYKIPSPNLHHPNTSVNKCPEQGRSGHSAEGRYQSPAQNESAMNESVLPY
jgi:hypothetical protein